MLSRWNKQKDTRTAAIACQSTDKCRKIEQNWIFASVILLWDL